MKPGREFSSRVSIRRIAWSCVALLALWAGTARAPSLIAFAQQTQKPSFEVASIKPGDPTDRRFGIGRRDNEFEVRNASLKLMIESAYHVQAHQIFGGPKWIDTDVFSIDARPSASTPLLAADEAGNRTFDLMLQSLLQERFKLAIHRETRMEPIYELVVSKGGPRLKDSEGPGKDGRQGIFGTRGGWAATNQGVGALIGMLSGALGRPVRDKTGLTGRYDYILTFTPEPTQPTTGTPQPEAVPPTDSNAPSIFTALQEQLGLKLESSRGPVEVLVIDNAERPEPN